MQTIPDKKEPLAGRLPFFRVAKYEKPSNDLTFFKEVWR